MNWTEISATLVTCGALIAFGIGYDQFVAWLEREGYDEGFTALLVAGGAAVTLIGIGVLDLFVDWNAGVIGLVCFTASGLPMIIGSLWRYAELRTQFKKTLDAMLGGTWK